MIMCICVYIYTTYREIQMVIHKVKLHIIMLYDKYEYHTNLNNASVGKIKE